MVQSSCEISPQPCFEQSSFDDHSYMSADQSEVHTWPRRYAELYTVAVTGSGGAYHLWPMGAPGGGAADAWPVVYIGSEGERAKVGRSVTEFLQIACSLAPYHPDAVGRLPGINTLPDNGDIAGATADDFDTAQVAALIEGRTGNHRCGRRSALGTRCATTWRPCCS